MMGSRLSKRSLAISGLTMAVMAGNAVASHAAEPVSCGGVAATIVSSKRVVVGTSGPDIIVVSGKARHTIKGLGGNDIICGSPGRDKILGGAGDDTIFAGKSADVISGGSGSDTLNGGSGRDTVVGGTGDDVIAGNSGNDTMRGNTGKDALVGGQGFDVLYPGAGSDVCATDSADAIVGACVLDAGSPQISATSQEVGLSAGTTATFTWSVADVAGISSTWLKIAGPSGWVTTWCGFGVEGTLISGDAKSGTYAVDCTIPIDAVNTSYTAYIDAIDILGNAAASTQQDFSVTNGVNDTSAPVVSNVEVSPSVTLGESFTITWRAQDESGVSGIIPWVTLGGYSFADNTGSAYVTYSSGTLVSGDSIDGTYSVTYTFNSNAQPGLHTIWISALDIYGNKVFYQTDVTFDVAS